MRWFVLNSLLLAMTAFAGESSADLLKQAQAALQQDKTEEALKLAEQSIQADAKNWQPYFFRARVYAAQKQVEKSVADYDKVIELEPKAAPHIYSERGSMLFRAGKVNESLADFDALVKAKPEVEPQLWQRGIAQYYAGKFDDGRKQFEVHQTVNHNDVENSAWHFLCNARANGLERARKEIIPIDGDGRVPMKEVHRMFKGELKVEDVLAAAKAGDPEPERLKKHLFYAHLYVGIYYEAIGENEKAKDFILKAADGYDEDDYMVSVAKVHAARLKK